MSSNICAGGVGIMLNLIWLLLKGMTYRVVKMILSRFGLKSLIQRQRILYAAVYTVIQTLKLQGYLLLSGDVVKN